nr:transferrin-binding protein-like solute binding protein [Marinicella sp. W31]MDC2879290.1 transferrin-binding protein-like solute binding protein [Marinicella sp. W31]
MTFDEGADQWQSEDSKALFTRNDDGTLTVQILEGAYAGDERTFTPRSGNGGSNGQATAYMTTYSLDDDPIVAVIDAHDVPGNDAAYYAFRSTEGLTENMPTEGYASYNGSQSGFAVQAAGSSGAIDGPFSAQVDFAHGTLFGRIGVTPGNSVDFRGTIDGAEFKSDPGKIALTKIYGSQYAYHTSVIDQNTSQVDGAFYGDAAKAMGGTYVINGQGGKEGTHLIGGFKADQ